MLLTLLNKPANRYYITYKFILLYHEEERVNCGVQFTERQRID